MVDMRTAAKQYAKDAIAYGIWSRIGKSQYQRVSGEKVFKGNAGWLTSVDQDKLVWPSLFAAMSAIDYKMGK